MKKFILLMLCLTSINAWSHCGTCGEGDAVDHSHDESHVENQAPEATSDEPIIDEEEESSN